MAIELNIYFNFQGNFFRVKFSSHLTKKYKDKTLRNIKFLFENNKYFHYSHT